VTIHDVARSAGVSRQTVSRALSDKAEIDGSTKQRVLDAARDLGYRPSRSARGLVRQDTTTVGLVVPTHLTVALPVLRPALAFLGIFTFVNAWNDYLWPLVVLIDSNHVTLQVALSQLNGLYVKDYSVVMAGTLVAVVPLIVVFLFGARHFIRNISAGALKG
jgi:hypothetical protein